MTVTKFLTLPVKADSNSLILILLLISDLFHWSCLNDLAARLPLYTAPAGYQCPTCQGPVFPPPNLASPIADTLREQLSSVNWARAGLGLPLVRRQIRELFCFYCEITCKVIFNVRSLMTDWLKWFVCLFNSRLKRHQRHKRVPHMMSHMMSQTTVTGPPLTVCDLGFNFSVCLFVYLELVLHLSKVWNAHHFRPNNILL